MSDEGFISRWSRRKQAVAKGGVPLALPASGAPEPATEPPVARPAAEAASEAQNHPPVAPAPAPPTLEDVQRLRPDSDYAAFVAPTTDNAVKRAALKKLFTDPHFNVMDGLDTYIDDYSRPDPIPEDMLRRMVQSEMLGLFRDDGEPGNENAQPKASPDGAGLTPVPQSPADATAAVPDDEDADLRLQPDDAAGPGGTGPGARA